MSSALERRLAAVERRLLAPQAALEVIDIRGGLRGGDPTFATAGGRRWERAPAELFADFKARAIAAAAAAGERFVVIGGLPRQEPPCP